MRKQKSFLLAAALLLALCVLSGCTDIFGNFFGGYKEESGERVPLRFDLSGAKAVMSAEGTGSGDRSLARTAGDFDKSPLFKILEDNSIASIFNFSDMRFSGNGVPTITIKLIARSPVAGKKDLYICFDQIWSYWAGNNDSWGPEARTDVASFIHVKEDGSVVNLTGTGDGNRSYLSYNPNNGYQSSYNDPVTFDKAGNLYYIAYDHNNNGNSTNVIYKYNPETSDITPLTAAAANISYRKVLLSDDGSNIIVLGSRGNYGGSSFLRLIPTASPDDFENIHYSSQNYSIQDFALIPESGDIIVSANNSPDGGGIGLYRIKKNPSTGTWEWIPMLNPGSGYIYFIASKYVNDNYTYVWRDEFCDGEGNPDYGKIMEALHTRFLSDYVEFRFNGKTNEEALAALTQTDMEAIFNGGGYNVTWFDDYMYRVNTGEQVTAPSPYNDYFGNIIATPANGIWGIKYDSYNMSKRTFVRLISNEEKRDLWSPEPLRDKIMNGMKLDSTHVYFGADILTNGSETGFHHLYRFSYDNPTNVENLFENLPSDIKDTLELYSFAEGGGYLYFSGIKGTRMLTGKINLDTLEYEQMEFGYKVTNLVVY